MPKRLETSDSQISSGDACFGYLSGYIIEYYRITGLEVVNDNNNSLTLSGVCIFQVYRWTIKLSLKMKHDPFKWHR